MLNRYLKQKLPIMGLLSLLASTSLHSQAEQLLSFEGRVTDLDGSALLYTEHHQIRLDGAGNYLSGYVVYRNPEGGIFAEKTLDYSKNALMPDLAFYDRRSEEYTQVSANQAQSHLQVLISSETKKDQSSLEIDEPLVVVDAGFDRLLESSWDQLRKAKELSFTFLAITRAKLINFEAVEINANDSTVFVELQPRNFFINMLVDPIALEYDIETQRLVRFEGLTNIEKFEQGKRTEENFVAQIEYSYQPLKAISSESTQQVKTAEEIKPKN